MNVLVLNPGSSSLKFQLFVARVSDALDVRLKGAVDRIGAQSAARFHMSVGDLPSSDAARVASMHDAAELLFTAMAHQSIDAIGYRVVHGGQRFEEPVRIDSAVIEEIKALRELAPLHNEAALNCIETQLKLLPDTPAVAVFDTSFHRTMPEVASRYAIPRALADKHQLHRFGFHGISHRYVSGKLLRSMGRDVPGSRLITCHLGNGASVCAIRDGKSIDTSMGLTPLEGLVMGTRSGDIDAGLVLHLIRVLHMSVDQVDDLLNHQSGLLGLSVRWGDVRDIEMAARDGDPNAEAAIESFAYRCRKYIGAYAAAMGGVDGIAFAGGVGEHSAMMRSRIVRKLAFLGIELNASENGKALGDEPRSIGAGRVGVWVVPTDEERQVAQEVFELLTHRTA